MSTCGLCVFIVLAKLYMSLCTDLAPARSRVFVSVYDYIVVSFCVSVFSDSVFVCIYLLVVMSLSSALPFGAFSFPCSLRVCAPCMLSTLCCLLLLFRSLSGRFYVVYMVLCLCS